ncbi:hypothetical protein [Bacillus cereus]|uniref:hypothetical protein n=1 Tax=Bacillus cereus TaxID=1396 RepID=UPI0018F38890|nr:hypothetical protein [Bacillus cereus]MBJ8023717.1 hypothetical protein [Bacillus cereus]
MKLSGSFKIAAVNKKTKAKGFEDLQVGDTVSFTWNLNGSYKGAPSVACFVNGNHVDTKNALTVKQLFTYNYANFEIEPTGVTISQEHLDSLQADADKLYRLEAYGVDNWSGYCDAMSDSMGVIFSE